MLDDTDKCQYCNDQFFIMYGSCKYCGRKCQPPLFDPDEGITLEEYKELRKEWLRDEQT